jgi:hypothetical protein
MNNDSFVLYTVTPDENEPKPAERVDLGELFGDSLEEFSQDMKKEITGRFSDDVVSLREEGDSFIKKTAEVWQKAFAASDALYVIVRSAAADYAEFVSKSEDDGHKMTYTALNSLHARALQEYLEIVTLVKNGFADGAFARWRSMYELAIISSFIAKYGEETAAKFIEAQDTEDRYDWAMASGIFPEHKRHVTFNDIQKSCEVDAEIWREDYTVANQTVHASPQGTFDSLGGTHSARSDYGIAAPAVQSANTLALISSMLLSVYSGYEAMSRMYIIGKWLDIIMDSYAETHDSLFPDD